jgi:hypothetical protein
MPDTPIPRAHGETARAAILRALELGQPLTLREISALVGLSEKELPDHLESLGRTVRRQGDRLEIEPSRCLSCDREFRGRERFTRPGRCPACRGTRLTPPRVLLVHRGAPRLEEEEE